MRELNWKAGQSAELSVLANAEGAVSEKRPARILEFSGKRMRLAAEIPAAAQLPGGAAVRLEWDGQLLLGEVLHAEPGGFWMEIHHMLLDTGLNWQKTGWQRG
jgi:hypothetical protein